jgi:hypothetical protein
MSGKQDVTTETLRNVQSTLIEPWTKAMRSWVTESEKLQQIAVENWNKAIDNSHKMAKESLDMAAGVGNTINKQVTAQVERTLDLMSTYTQR